MVGMESAFLEYAPETRALYRRELEIRGKKNPAIAQSHNYDLEQAISPVVVSHSKRKREELPREELPRGDKALILHGIADLTRFVLGDRVDPSWYSHSLGAIERMTQLLGFENVQQAVSQINGGTFHREDYTAEEIYPLAKGLAEVELNIRMAPGHQVETELATYNADLRDLLGQASLTLLKGQSDLDSLQYLTRALHLDSTGKLESNDATILLSGLNQNREAIGILKSITDLGHDDPSILERLLVPYEYVDHWNPTVQAMQFAGKLYNVVGGGQKFLEDANSFYRVSHQVLDRWKRRDGEQGIEDPFLNIVETWTYFYGALASAWTEDVEGLRERFDELYKRKDQDPLKKPEGSPGFPDEVKEKADIITTSYSKTSLDLTRRVSDVERANEVRKTFGLKPL